MRRFALLMVASVFVFVACSDDDNPPPKKDTGTVADKGGTPDDKGTTKPDGKVATPDKGTTKPDGKVTTPDKGTPADGSTTPSAYKIVITEIMSNPAKVYDSKGEYFEIYNAGTKSVDLTGWTVKDKDKDKHVVKAASGTTSIGVGKFLVLGNNKDTKTNGGVKVDYTYGTSWYISGADEIILLDKNGKEVDKVYWTSTWKFASGASHSLKDPSLDNNKAANWCLEKKAWTGSAGDKGTPGAKAGCGP